MIVKEAMSSGVHIIDPNATIQDAALLMKSTNVGMLPVIKDEKILGVVTDRDLVTRCLADGLSKTAHVSEAMTLNPVTLDAAAPIDRALELMSDHRIARILIQDDDGKLVGVISATDALAVSNGQKTAGRLMTALNESHKSKVDIAKLN